MLQILDHAVIDEVSAAFDRLHIAAAAYDGVKAVDVNIFFFKGRKNRLLAICQLVERDVGKLL